MDVARAVTGSEQCDESVLEVKSDPRAVLRSAVGGDEIAEASSKGLGGIKEERMNTSTVPHAPMFLGHRRDCSCSFGSALVLVLDRYWRWCMAHGAWLSLGSSGFKDWGHWTWNWVQVNCGLPCYRATWVPSLG